MSNSGLKIGELIQLGKLTRKRFNSPQDYQALEYFQGQLLVRYLEKQKLSLSGKKTLDLGMGFGGYAQALQARGAWVTGADIAFPKNKLDLARVCADGICAPFISNSFDLVISISLIEHVEKPEKLIEEMVRLTKPGGYIYLSFPPFYSPVGGHHFSPWHLLGEKVAVWAFSKRKWHVNQNWTDEPYDFESLSYKKAFGRYGLFPLSIGDVRKLISKVGLILQDQSVKYVNINVSRLPLISEILTWQVQFLARKV